MDFQEHDVLDWVWNLAARKRCDGLGSWQKSAVCAAVAVEDVYCRFAVTRFVCARICVGSLIHYISTFLLSWQEYKLGHEAVEGSSGRRHGGNHSSVDHQQGMAETVEATAQRMKSIMGGVGKSTALVNTCFFGCLPDEGNAHAFQGFPLIRKWALHGHVQFASSLEASWVLCMHV